MAKRISNEKIQLDIIINGNEAQKELFELEKATRDVTAEQKELRKEKQLLQKQNKIGTERYKAVTAALRENNTTLRKNKARISELQNQIGITGLTMGQLTRKANQLRLTLKGMIPGSADYKKYSAELKQVSSRIDELKGKGKAAAFSISNLTEKFNKYAGITASFLAAGAGVVLTLQKMIDYNGKLSDAQSNVMKTTGMTKTEVDELTKSFGVLKTRTSRINLLGIAEVGGRLGIAKEELQDFVRVMDKSAVALGDSFQGGADVVAEKLGRIKGLYEDLKNAGVEEVFESVGSAMNDLGASGTASEQNIAEFTTRVGAMPDVLKPAINEALGLGAAFEESGLRAEIAGTNYAKVISIASRDVDAFAKVMQRPKKELEDLINSNPTEFFLQFSQSLNGLKATELSTVLDYLKLNDNEVKMVLGAASQNTELFREKIALASESMAEATSLTEEYNIKNNNLAATLERIKKTIFGWFSSESVVAWLEKFVNGFAKLIGATDDAENSMSAWRNTLVFTAKVLAIVAASLLSYAAGAKLATLWSNTLGKANAFSNIVMKVQNALMIIQETRTKALALAKALLSFNIGKVRAAYQALAVTMGMNPFGALLAVIGAVIAAFIAFRKETSEVNKVIEAHKQVMQAVAEQTGKTKNKISDLLTVLKDENATYDEKKKALEELKRVGKGYLDTLTLENALTAEGDRLIKKYIASIDKLAEAKAVVDVKSKLRAQKMESDNKMLALQKEKDVTETEGSAFWGGADGRFLNIGSRNKVEIQTEIDEEDERNRMIDIQIEAINSTRDAQIKKLRDNILKNKKLLEEAKKGTQEFNQLSRDIANDEETLNILLGITTGDDSSGVTITPLWIPDKKDEKAADKAKRDHDKRMKDLKEQLKEAKELSRKAIDERLEQMKEGYEKEVAIEEENHRRKLEDLKAQLIAEDAIIKAQEKMLDPNATKQEQDYWSRQMQVWIEKNMHLHQLLELEESRHKKKMATIDEKAEEDRIKSLQETFDLETIARKTAHNNEMAALGDNEKARKALQKKFNKEELEREKAFLESMVAELQAILSEDSHLDFTLLNDSEREKFIQQVAELKLKISELVDEKSKLTNKENDIESAGMAAFGDADVLGFTVKQWADTFRNIDTLQDKLKAAGMAVGGMRNLWGAFSDYVAASENARLQQFDKNAERKKRKLQWQLDNGIISNEEYQRRLQLMEAELELKRAGIEYKQAKRRKAMALFDATINTAKGITAAFPNALLMALVAAAGALQIATIKKEPLPARGYEKGLYPEYVKREQDGKIYRSTYRGRMRSGLVKKTSHFLVAEGDQPEMIIDSKSYKAMSPETRNALERELRGIKGFEQGYYNDNFKNGSRYELPVNSTPVMLNNNAVNPVNLDYALEIIKHNTEVMERALNEGFIGYFSRDPRELKKFQEELDRIKKSRDKARV